MKARYRLTSKKNAVGQLVKRDAYENEMYMKGRILHSLGVELLVEPESSTRTSDAAETTEGSLAMRCVIAADEKRKISLPDLISDNPSEPALIVSFITDSN